MSPNESSTVSSVNQVPETVVRLPSHFNKNRKISRDMKKILTYQTSSMKYCLRSVVLVTPQQVMLVLSYSMLIYYVYLDDDGNSKSVGRFDASSDMQPIE